MKNILRFENYNLIELFELLPIYIFTQAKGNIVKPFLVFLAQKYRRTYYYYNIMLICAIFLLDELLLIY